MSKTTHRYLIPAQVHLHEIEIQKSRFITRLAHAPTAEDARNFVDALRQQFPDATHHCWAFVAGPPGDSRSVGMSDDGEPSGTAGKPMLTVLMHSEVGEIVAVVTRYFGGQKLGTGGLVRAYTQAVQDALATLPTQEHVITIDVTIEAQYPDHGTIERLLQEWEIDIESTEYTDKVTMHIKVPDDRWEGLRKQIIDRSAGRAHILGTSDSDLNP